MRIYLMLVVVALAAGPAAADPRPYLMPFDQVATLHNVAVHCDTDIDSLGGVCFPTGHVTSTGATKSATLTLIDFLQVPVSAVYCQNYNDDHTCGGPGEPNDSFCGTHRIRSEAEGSQSANWDESFPVYIFVDGPVNGNLVTTPCTTSHWSFGSFGEANHG
jgi:hypothetical protein